MLIDITRLVHRRLRGRLPTGIDRVSLAYLERYGERASALLRIGGRWLTLDRRASQPVFDALVGRQPRTRRALAASVARGLATRLRRNPRHQLLVNVSHGGLEHPRYALEVRRRQLRPLYFVHDLIPVTHPEAARPGQHARHHRRLQTMLASGHALVVNSRCTLEELEAYARRMGLRLPQTSVAPLAPPTLPRAHRRPPIDAPYFVIVGTIEPRKNHAMLLRLWQQLGRELGAAAPRLIVIGQPGWNCAPTLSLLDRCPLLRQLVIARPRCGDAELASWLGHSRALLFPSFVEGYGLPLVEALALGVAVIASRLPVFREIAGDIPEYLDPRDATAWREAILGYLDPEAESTRRQRQRLSGYVAPTWDAHFAAVDPLVESCLRPSSHPLAPRDWAYAPLA